LNNLNINRMGNLIIQKMAQKNKNHATVKNQNVSNLTVIVMQMVFFFILILIGEICGP